MRWVGFRNQRLFPGGLGLNLDTVSVRAPLCQLTEAKLLQVGLWPSRRAGVGGKLGLAFCWPCSKHLKAQESCRLGSCPHTGVCVVMARVRQSALF